MIPTFLYNDNFFNQIVKEIGNKNMEDFLNIINNDQTVLFNNWQKHVMFKNSQLITKSYNIDLTIKVNLLLSDKLIKWQENLLNKKINDYYQQYSQQYNQFRHFIKDDKFLIMLPTLNYNNSYILKTADEELPVKDLYSLKKIGLISFFVSFIFIIFLVFIIDFFKKINWLEIKNNNK